MPLETHETSQEGEFEDVNRESSDERAISSPDTSRMGESSISTYTDCADLVHSDMRRTPWSYKPAFEPKFLKRFSDKDLARFYTCSTVGSNLNGEKMICSEKPLDFSRKPISSVRKDEFPKKFKKVEPSSTITSQRYQEISSEGTDDSCSDEGISERFAVYSHANRTRQPRAVFQTNGSGNTIFDYSEEYRHKLNNVVLARRARRNGLKAADSSGSEEEFHPEYSVNNSRSFEANGVRSRRASMHTAFPMPENTKLPPFPHGSNSHSKNGFSISNERNGFHIQDLLSQDNQPFPKEHSGIGRQITNFMTQQRTSPQPSVGHLGKEENLPPKATSPNEAENIPCTSTSPSHAMNLPSASTSPNHVVNLPTGYSSPSHSMPLPPAKFQFGTIGGFNESNGVLYPCVPTAFAPNQMANVMSKGYPGEMPGYSRPYPYAPGAMLQAPFNGVLAQPYPQALLAGQDQQMPKKNRPFKEIDTKLILQQLQLAPASTYSGYNSQIAECTGPTVENTSPQSPDSQTNVNGSSTNESQQQDTNDVGGRKRVRQTPPEEKDEKYLEKRRKNNLAAKKSRDERKKKEDDLAESVRRLMDLKFYYETRLEAMYNDYKYKENKLEMVTASLISYREKLEADKKEIFEETFKPFLPQPLG